MNIHRGIHRADSVLELDEYFRQWSTLHSNVDPRSSYLVYSWLRLMYVLGRACAVRSVSPHTVTVAGFIFASSAVLTAMPGAHWPLLAAGLVIISAVLDGVDGAVAVVGRSDSRWGYVLDTVADRCSDLCFLGAAYVLGAPPVLLIATGAATLLQESARARAVAVGLDDIGVLTVWERPSRVITAVVITAGAGMFPASGAFVALMGSYVALGLSIIGFFQLMVALFRRLAGSPG